MLFFKTRSFYRWAKEQKLKDEVLRKAVQEIEEGLYEANLGGSVYKKGYLLETVEKAVDRAL